MFNKSKIIAALSCSLIMLSTVLAFSLIFKDFFDIKMCCISLLFLLLAEAVLMAKHLLIRKITVFTGAHITSSIIYCIIIFLASVLLIFNIINSLSLFLLINIIFLSILIVTDLLVYFMQNYIVQKESKQLSAQEMICHCISQVQQLSLPLMGTEYYSELSTIENLLKYSDNSVITGDETVIEALISELSTLINGDCIESAPVHAKIEAIAESVQKRTIQVKIIQRGRY